MRRFGPSAATHSDLMRGGQPLAELPTPFSMWQIAQVCENNNLPLARNASSWSLGRIGRGGGRRGGNCHWGREYGRVRAEAHEVGRQSQRFWFRDNFVTRRRRKFPKRDQCLG